MKKKIIKLIDGISIFLFHSVTNSRKTFYQLDEINFKESAEFINKHGGSAALLEKKTVFWEHAINQIPDTGLILEFGVFQGHSINFFSRILANKNDSRKIYGFDSFEGLSEDWAGTHMLKSTFDQKGKLPKVNKNVQLVKGWIDETLPPFLKDNNEFISFMHIDMDTYTPTKVIFKNTVERLVSGTIIVFDELLGYSGWKNGEFKALTEIIHPIWNYEYISFCEPKEKSRHKSKYIRATIKILERKTTSNTM